MFLDKFYQQNAEIIKVSPEQASLFAKSIANDFNPIHDPEHKRFCVPGDLLFSLVLAKYGIQEEMAFSFEGMVGKDVALIFPEHFEQPFCLCDDKDKQYLSIEHTGVALTDQNKIAQFIQAYVAFSGLNFTEILIPLMQEHQVMINPARPLVIYENMSFKLDHFDFMSVRLELEKAALIINGKRGDVMLNFKLLDGDRHIGTGSKALVLSGLREYEQESVKTMLDLYNARKNEFISSRAA